MFVLVGRRSLWCQRLCYCTSNASTLALVKQGSQVRGAQVFKQPRSVSICAFVLVTQVLLQTEQ